MIKGTRHGKAELTRYCSNAGLAFQMKPEFLNVVCISHAGPRRVCPPSMLFFPHLPWLLWLTHEELWSGDEPTAPIRWGGDWKERTSWWRRLPTAAQGSSAGQNPRGTLKGGKDEKDHESINSGIYCVTLGTCWFVGHVFTSFAFYPQLRVSPKEFGGQVTLRKLTTSWVPPMGIHCEL